MLPPTDAIEHLPTDRFSPSENEEHVPSRPTPDILHAPDFERDDFQRFWGDGAIISTEEVLHDPLLLGDHRVDAGMYYRIPATALHKLLAAAKDTLAGGSFPSILYEHPPHSTHTDSTSPVSIRTREGNQRPVAPTTRFTPSPRTISAPESSYRTVERLHNSLATQPVEGVVNVAPEPSVVVMVTAKTPTRLAPHLEVLEIVNPGWADLLKSLTFLQPNWDGYGAEPISEPAAVQTCRVLQAIAKGHQGSEYLQLFIAPMPDGGIEIDLDLPEERELMLVMPPEGTPIRFLSTTRDQTGAEAETEGTVGPNTSIPNLVCPAS